MNGAAFLGIDADSERIKRRGKTGYCDVMVTSLDEALRILKNAVRKREATSVGVVGKCEELSAELEKRGVVPDLLTDQTSAHDPIEGYVPNGMTLEAALELRKKDPKEYRKHALAAIAQHVRGMLDLQKLGAVTFDYGNNIRTFAFEQGVKNAYDFPGFVPAYIRPLFCEGKGPFRWAAPSAEASNSASGASWVSIHNGGGVGIGYSQHSGQVSVADGTKEMAKRIERVLTNDRGLGIAGHADAGYREGMDFAKRHGVKVPMI